MSSTNYARIEIADAPSLTGDLHADADAFGEYVSGLNRAVFRACCKAKRPLDPEQMAAVKVVRALSAKLADELATAQAAERAAWERDFGRDFF